MFSVTTKSVSVPFKLTADQSKGLQQSVVSKRYKLHEISSRIMLDPAFNTDAEQALIDSGKYPRVTQCHKIPLLNGDKVSDVQGVSLRKNPEHGSVHFGGLMSCGSVWDCPCCSVKISEYRCKEINRAFNAWLDMDKKNHTQIMVTFTIPHYADQKLFDLRRDFMQARRLLKQQKPLKRKKLLVFKELSSIYGVHGSLSSVEVTWGYNGWHPHTHDIFFVKKSLTDEQLKMFKKYLIEAWIYACKRAKLHIPSEENMRFHSVDVSRARSAAEYLAKFGKVDYEKHMDILSPSWGPSQEMTKGHIKTSKGADGMTPWDFLRIIQANPGDHSIYMKFGRLFREYVRCFRGKRQLFWSKNLKSELNIVLLSDEEVAEMQDESSELIGVIPPHEWRIIIKRKMRGEVLYLAQHLQFNDLMEYIRCKGAEDYGETQKEKRSGGN